MPRPITPEDLLLLKLPEDPHLSPDGTQVAYVVMEMDRETTSIAARSGSPR